MKRYIPVMATLVALSLPACSGLSDTQQRTVTGGAAGAAGGAALGAITGGSAAVGGAAGALGGYISGEMKKE